MAQWKAGWAQRSAIAIDDTNVDATLTWFPVPLLINSTSGIGNTDIATIVFTELTTNSTKLAVTQADGVTELKVEIEEWTYNAGTVADSTGVLWVSLDGWAIPTSGTTIYLYYDATHADNANVGVIGSAPGEAVWDSNFKMVQHMGEATHATLVDSIGNHDSATNTMDSNAAGKIGQAMNGDGTEWATFADHADWNLGTAWNINMWVNFDTITDGSRYNLIAQYYATDDDYWVIRREASNKLQIFCLGDADVTKANYYTTADWKPSTGTWYYLSFVRDTSSAYIYINGVSQGVTEGTAWATLADLPAALWIGAWADATSYGIVGTLDECRLSNIARSAAWLKANYYAQSDNFLTWGSEEIGFIPQVTMF